jgi:hypothetical protein
MRSGPHFDRDSDSATIRIATVAHHFAMKARQGNGQIISAGTTGADRTNTGKRLIISALQNFQMAVTNTVFFFELANRMLLPKSMAQFSDEIPV